MVEDAVMKTALSALHAKCSMISAGYEPVKKNGCLYESSLNLIFQGLECIENTTLLRKKMIKRQSPLVNIGYATRVTIVSRIIENFVSFHSKNLPVSVVFLGGGMDALGIWALSLAPEDMIRVHEIDCDVISDMKRKALLFSEILQVEDSNYTLIPVDLVDKDKMKQVFTKLIKTDCPTLIISELVLAYIPEDPMKNLLSLIASNCRHSGSLFIAYEPTTYDGSDNVIKQFSREYFDLFQNNLNIGYDNNKSIHFKPLGSHTEELFQKCGFSHINCVPVGSVAACVSSCLKPVEPFDEYASLVLHLSCYTVVSALTSFDSDSNDVLENSCPWLKRKHETIQKKCHCHEIENLEISPIVLEEEEHVVQLYQDVYQSLMNEYKSIEKMVKTALKTDLNITTPNEENTQNISNILLKYQSYGGSFWTARIINDNKETVQVVGCLGIKSCKSCESKEPTFEIHRLVVDKKNRNKGIGNSLLKKATEFIKKYKSSKIIETPVCILAHTPSFMIGAHHLYTNNGFSVCGEKIIGAITLITYCKRFSE